MRHLDQFQIMHDPILAFGLALALRRLVDRQPHIFLDRQPGQQRMVLKHHRPIRPRRVHHFPTEEDGAARRLDQTRHGIEQGRLAAARMADQGHELSFVDFQIDPVERAEASRLGRKFDRDTF